MRNRGYVTHVDTAFAEVIRALRQQRAAARGHLDLAGNARRLPAAARLGYAHSVETWLGPTLVGGLYGVALGRVFFGESMFSTERDASKVALARLVEELIGARLG